MTTPWRSYSQATTNLPLLTINSPTGCHPEIELLGISTVSGNQEIEKVTTNALQVVTYAGLENIGNSLLVYLHFYPCLEVHEGVGKPLIAETRHVPEIHGESGMDLEKEDSTASDFSLGIQLTQTKNPKNALFALRDAIVQNPQSIVKVICTGPLTNLALFVSIFPELIDKFEVVCMGGSIGIGNMPSGAEFNFFSDPHAAKIVFKSGVRLTMIPLEVTHLALFTPEVHAKMFPEGTNTHFQTFVSRLLLYFTKTIKDIYAMEYPAIHDPCAVYYAIRPQHFEVRVHDLSWN